MILVVEPGADWTSIVGFSIYFVRLQGFILTLERSSRFFTFKDLRLKILSLISQRGYQATVWLNCCLLLWIMLQSSSRFWLWKRSLILNKEKEEEFFLRCLTTALKIKESCKGEIQLNMEQRIFSLEWFWLCSDWSTSVPPLCHVSLDKISDSAVTGVSALTTSSRASLTLHLEQGSQVVGTVCDTLCSPA